MPELKDTNGKKFTFYDVAKDDYPELEQKIIKYDAGIKGIHEISTGIVVGCNTSVGITIVDATNKERYLVCYTGEVVPGGGNMHNYDPAIWGFLIDSIYKGFVRGEELIAYETTKSIRSGWCDGKQCAYKQ